MTRATFRFDRFQLDLGDRQVSDGDSPLELNSRYFDALALLVGNQGRLVSKDRFMEEVWRGVPVTDEALTQCIRTLRRQLGDDAARPRFIETVPKHGYRFIAPVEVEGEHIAETASSSRSWHRYALLGLAGVVGGGLAGFIGGLFYGFAGASQPLQPGMGAVSVLLVLLALTIIVALIGAAGVAFGIAGAAFASGRIGPWSIAGGALGGLIVGAVVKLLGLDAFTLLFGRAPGEITGAFEGFVLGAAVGLGTWLATRRSMLRYGTIAAAALGGLAGMAIPLLGGRLMGGSLALLADHFPGSRLRLDRIGALFGETGFGAVTQTVTATLEAALFSGFVVAAMLLAKRQLEQGRD
ncbi:MAG TPA: transcriptional regulator [Sphingomicrobium sp.]|nr:transcriptional regulator [Sphingomicrobium sp.]